MAKPLPPAAPASRARFLVHLLLCLVGSTLFLYWQLTTHTSLTSIVHTQTTGSGGPTPPSSAAAAPAAASVPAAQAQTQSHVAPVSDELVSVQSQSGHSFKHVPYVVGDVAVLRWGIMFDAGSTGSRVHIYRFRMPAGGVQQQEGGEALQPLLEDEIFAEVKPGLSAFVPSGVGAEQSTRDVGAPTASSSSTELGTGPDAAAASLRSLMDLCLEMIPLEARARTPISLRATAGLRLLGEEVAESILVSIRDLFATYPFPFERDDVAVMRGSEEGVFAWLTVNYLEQQLQDYKIDEETARARHDAQRAAGSATAGSGSGPASDSLLTHHHPRTSAILDLGGASTQIVFEPDFPSYKQLAPEAAAKLYRLPYGSNTYYLYETSYLGYGLMEARRRVKENLIQQAQLQVHPLVSPTTTTTGAAAAAPSTSDGAASTVGVEVASVSAEGLPIKYHPCLSDTHSEIVDLDGVRTVLRGYAQGHASCAEVTRTLFAKEAPCELSPYCSFGGHFALPLHGMFAKTDAHASTHGHTHGHGHGQAHTHTHAQNPGRMHAHSPVPLHSSHSLDGAQAKIFAFSYFYDRTLDVFDLPEESGPRAAADGGGTVVALERLRHLADQVCAFSMEQHRVRSAASIEEEKEAARAALQKALDKRQRDGCRTVTVRQADGSTRIVALPDQEQAPVSADGLGASATAALPSLDQGACMVEERPDLSADAERQRADISETLVEAIGTNPYLCLDLTYAHTLLHYGYDLPESIELHIMKRMQKKEIGWCLGAMLAQMAQRGW